MTDHDKDLALLKLMGGGRRVSTASLGVSLACTAVAFGLAFWSSTQGNSTLILVALLMFFANVFLIIQYSVSGPLIREMQRLRADLDKIGGHEHPG